MYYGPTFPLYLAPSFPREKYKIMTYVSKHRPDSYQPVTQSIYTSERFLPF